MPAKAGIQCFSLDLWMPAFAGMTIQDESASLGIIVFTESDNYFMLRAFELAKVAELHGEVPVGAVLVYDGEIISEGFNQPINQHDATAHAEIMALRQAGQHLKNYRLINTTLYVTLEPCVMCAGAMIHARVQRLVFAANDLKTGAAGSVFDIFNSDKLNHKVQCQSGLMAEQCSALLTEFFKKRR